MREPTTLEGRHADEHAVGDNYDCLAWAQLAISFGNGGRTEVKCDSEQAPIRRKLALACSRLSLLAPPA